MCKVRWQLMVMVLLMMAGGVAMGVGDVTTPGDPVIGQPNDNDWPGGEAPQYAIDNNVNTKFLHFRSLGDIAGIIITPKQGTPNPVSTIVQGLSFTTANDSAGRDPISYELYGSNGTAAAGPWTLINNGAIVDFSQSAEWPRLTKGTTPIFFSNSTSYLHYKIMFPTLRGGVNELFQIAEIELIDEWLPSVAVNPAQKIIVLPDTTVTVDATVTDIDSTSWTYAWTQISGPAVADFGGTESQQDPTITGLTARGTYVFQVIVTDDDGNPSDPVQVKVRVWDTTVDQTLVARWAFNEGSGATANDSTVDNDKGIFGNNKITDPNFKIPSYVPGWIPSDGTNNYALNFTRFSYVEVTPDPNAVHDPNMKTLDGGVSVAAWVNADDWNGNRRIMQFGNPARSDEENIFRLLREGNGMRFVASSMLTRELTVPIFPAAEWHHVVGTYNGKTINIYIDGVLAGTKEFTTEALLYPYASQAVSI
ncbi:MAG: LamG-like jellyroll fold domain-containing protein, partial [Anaerohalosphaeraceae bacterium]